MEVRESCLCEMECKLQTCHRGGEEGAGGTHRGSTGPHPKWEAVGVWRSLFIRYQRTLQLTPRVLAASSPSTDGGNKEAKNGNTNWCVALLWQFVTEQSRIPCREVVLVKVTRDLFGGIKSNRHLAGQTVGRPGRPVSWGHEVGRCPLAISQAQAMVWLPWGFWRPLVPALVNSLCN